MRACSFRGSTPCALAASSDGGWSERMVLMGINIVIQRGSGEHHSAQKGIEKKRRRRRAGVVVVIHALVRRPIGGFSAARPWSFASCAVFATLIAVIVVVVHRFGASGLRPLEEVGYIIARIRVSPLFPSSPHPSSWLLLTPPGFNGSISSFRVTFPAA